MVKGPRPAGVGGGAVSHVEVLVKELRKASEVQPWAEVKSPLFLGFSQGPRAVQQKLGSWSHLGLEETSRRQPLVLSRGP